jgi:hypothetical protein
MKSIRKIFGGLFIGVAAFNFLHAQEAATPDQSVRALTDMDVMLQALEQTTPTPALQLPADTHGFYSAQNPDWPPMPGDFLGLPAWPLGDGLFVLDDTNINYVEIQAENEAAEALAAALSPRKRMSMMASSLATSYAYGNPVYLTNMAAMPDGYGNTIASFSIAGGTNFVPYDILMSTNVAMPVASWNWLGIGYTSNNYTFYGQPADVGFYILAKPSKTMVVPWGDDTYGQCDLWSGITNAVQVTGGIEFSLALLTNGTVVGWGYNGATSSELVPTNLVGVTMIASGWEHNVALLTNGTVTAWGDDFWGEINVPAGLTNVTVISAQSLHSLALESNGTVVAWGYGPDGETNVPAGLTNVTAIAAGGMHNLAVSNGIVVAWGYNGSGQCNVPAGLSNVWDVAAGWVHSVALKTDGTVVCWGDNSDGESTVPAGLSNVVAIAAGGDFDTDTAYTLALKSDGTVMAWGDSDVLNPVDGLNDVIAIGGGVDHALAVRTGPPTPVITLAPVDQYQIAGSNVTFTAKGTGLYGVTYQWQTNGVNLSGATNTTLALTNVQAAQAGSYDVAVTDNGGMGSLTSSNANLYLITAPVIISQTPMPTNQVAFYHTNLTLSVIATGVGQFDGFPLSYQWQFNGTNISSAHTSSYSFYATDISAGTYSVIVSNAAGSARASWLVTMASSINVTNDLLLIYNTNSLDSSNVCAYYLAHRPMVGGANVLGIGCPTSEITSSSTFSNQILTPYLNWLAANSTKHPQYLILFLGIPSRVDDTAEYPSVQYQLATALPTFEPYVTSINMNGTNDCIGYINKLVSFGTNYSPGQLVISASAGGYGNTNYVLDGVRDGGIYPPQNNYSGDGDVVAQATNALLANGVSSSAIIYNDGLDILSNGISYNAPQITNAANISAYMSWGQNGGLGPDYAINGTVKFQGNSSWYVIETVESDNGQVVQDTDQGNFIKWYSSNAFGGTNYSNTPIGAVSHVEEPGLPGVENSAIYFGLWAGGKNFAICAWNSRNTPYFQAVGDPFVTK